MHAYLMIVSGAAGSAEDEAVEAARAVLAEAGAVEVAVSQHPEDLDSALDALDGRTLVVAGGDGSIHVTVEALDRRGELATTPLGIVPLGTGNDLARTLGVPLDPSGAARCVVRGTARPLDLMRTPESTIVNAAHAGIGVLAAERAAGMKGALGAAAYPAGAVAAGVSADPVRLRVEVDGVGVGDGDLLLVGVGNGRSVGGGTVLFPSAEPADGLLDVVAVADGGVWDRLRLGLAARSGDHADLDGVVTARGREIIVRGSAAWNDDGEIGELVEDRWLRVDPGAWRVVF